MTDVIECLKCDRRFIENRTEKEFRNKPCLYCDNKDLMETIVCCPEMYIDCDCNDCIDIKNNLRRKQNDRRTTR